MASEGNLSQVRLKIYFRSPGIAERAHVPIREEKYMHVDGVHKILIVVDGSDLEEIRDLLVSLDDITLVPVEQESQKDIYVHYVFERKWGCESPRVL